VRDTGIGLSDVARRRLFQPFTQADGSTTRRYGGTGLGLAISKRLVELMGGEIGVQSEEGEGSTFWFRVPFELGSSAAADRSLASASPSGPVVNQGQPSADADSRTATMMLGNLGALVLLAEDNPVNQRVTRVKLESLGVGLEIAANGLEALAAHEPAPFDLILMDCQMPEMDGFEASRCIRRLEAISGAHVPIIALTANALEGDREICLAAGMDDYLPKHVTAAELEAALLRWLLRPGGDATADQARLDSPDEPDEPPLLDPERLDRLRALSADDDPDIVMEIVELFAADLPRLVAAMREAGDTSDAETLRIHAHSLKGSAANMGASELSQRAASIEQRAAARNLSGLADPMTEIESLSTRVVQALRSWAEAA